MQVTARDAPVRRLDDMLEVALAAMRADFGSIQLHNTRTGETAGQGGVASGACVSAEAGGRATRAVRPRSAHERSAFSYSLPLTSQTGRKLGMLTVRYRTPRQPGTAETRLADTLVRHLVGCLEDRRRLQEARPVVSVGRDARIRVDGACGNQDESIAVLAHELSQPIAAARAAAALISKRHPGDRTVQVVERQLTQMMQLLNDFRSRLRMVSGTVKLNRHRLDLRSVVHQAVDAASPACEMRQQTLNASLHEKPVWISADEMRLQQALSNLLQNAVFYTPPGGKIDVAMEARGNWAVFRCRDTGVGIPAHALERIFKLSDRGLQPNDSRRSGIGLTVARRMVELHGGRLSARSAGTGRGSEFIVELPAADRAAAKKTP